MAEIIQISCNGPDRCVNEVDLDKALQKTYIPRSVDPGISQELPKRIVLPCQSCTDGKVIITREMIEDLRGRS